MRLRTLALLLAVAGCSTSSFDAAALGGAWFTDGPSFDIVVGEKTILFEFDMREHPYRLQGDVLLIEFDDGVQRKRVVRLTRDEMEWEDEPSGARVVFYRRGAWERSRINPPTSR